MKALGQKQGDWQEQLAPGWQIREFVKKYRRVAVVGLPRDPGSEVVLEVERMLGYDFEFFPVHSECGDVTGHGCVAHLHLVTEPVDILLVVPGAGIGMMHLAKEAIQKRVKVFWVEDAPIDQDVAELLMQAGIHVVANRNLQVEFFKVSG